MDSQQQFCLKWNSFGSNLAAAFSNLFKSESLADVTLFCEGVTFKAHKLILAACSKHLADLFETAPLHQNLLVILDGTSAANMSALLEFMYKGEVHVSQDALSSFLKAAECLQVKGLSIEHEKLAVAHSQQQQTQQQQQQQSQQQQQQQQPSSLDGPPESPTVRNSSSSSSSKHAKLTPKEEADQSQAMHHPVSSPSSYSPAMSPYMHPHHYRQYEQRLPASASVYDSPRKRHLPSPSELLQDSVRASVLRDGSKGRPGSPAGGGHMSLAYRPSSSSSSSLPPGGQPEADGPPEHRYEPDAGIGAATTTFDRAASGGGGGGGTAAGAGEENSSATDHRRPSSTDPASPEDLRMKMEPPVQEEPLSSTVGGSNGSANGTVAPPLTYETDRDKEIISASMWSSVQGKLGKAGSVTTPDGKKLKCPFCERLYGYETNLRAHIRQRHQGIRVPCPFCSRTFTRNNTVRRHIAREHKAELSLKAFQQTQQYGPYWSGKC